MSEVSSNVSDVMIIFRIQVTVDPKLFSYLIEHNDDYSRGD